MSVQEIETAVTRLAPDELSSFSKWFEEYTADQWDRPYTREQAAWPVKTLHDWKFWPPVSRIDNVYGDRNVMCSCAGMDEYR